MRGPSCCHCHKGSKLISGRELFPFNYAHHNKYYWYCEKCDAWTGAQKISKRPVGNPADYDLRKLRIKCHEYFDQLYDCREGRTKAYNWLSNRMQLPKTQTHFALFNTKQCKKALKKIKKEFY